MIVGIGLTPAWQQILEFAELAPGEVNRARAAHWCASGKILNVGVALARLGAEHTIVTPLGGPAEAPIRAELAALGVRAVVVPTSAATRACTTLLERSSGRVTELVENQAPYTRDELDAYHRAASEQLTRATFAVFTGSLPENTPTCFYRELLTVVGGRAIVDAGGPELTAALAQRPLLVKPNREELSRTLGRSLDNDESLVSGMRELCRAGAQSVLVTQGAGDVLLASAERVHRLTPPRVERVVNTIGCGDCLAAAAARALAVGAELVEAVREGMGAAANNAQQLIPARLELDAVRRFAQAVKITTL